MCSRVVGEHDNLVDTIFDGLQEQSRLKNKNAQRKFIEFDDQEAVKIEVLERCKEVHKVVRPNLTRKFSQKRTSER